MDLEKLIDSIPEKHFFKKDNNTAGFCLRYSVGNNLWVAGYGHNRASKHKHAGRGYSPLEAILDFKSKI